MNHRKNGLRAALATLAVAVLLALPLAASAHSEFVSASPADGSTVTGTPTEIVLTFSAKLDAKKSSIILRDASGAQIATGGVDPAKTTTMQMTPPALEAGAYEIDWTSVATDGDLLRGKTSFTVEAPAPTPSPTPAATAVPSVAPSAVVSPSPTPSPSPAPSAAPASTSASGTDVILPVIVAILLIAALGARLLSRRNVGGSR